MTYQGSPRRLTAAQHAEILARFHGSKANALTFVDRFPGCSLDRAANNGQAMRPEDTRALRAALTQEKSC